MRRSTVRPTLRLCWLITITPAGVDVHQVPEQAAGLGVVDAQVVEEVAALQLSTFRHGGLPGGHPVTGPGLFAVVAELQRDAEILFAQELR